MARIAETHNFWHFVFLLFLMLFLLPSVTGHEVPELLLQDQVFVALKGEDLSIKYELKKPPNQTEEMLTCFDPHHKQIHSCAISAGDPLLVQDVFVLKNMTISGEYYCQYKTARVYWFLRVRDNGYKEVIMFDYTELIVVAVFTGVLLVFSVVGSVYVFRGHWECSKADDKTQNRDQRKEDKKDKAHVEPSQSASVYASLEPRPRSIYDVLDHSAASRQKDQPKAMPKKKENQKTTGKGPQNQDEGIFECVYENF